MVAVASRGLIEFTAMLEYRTDPLFAGCKIDGIPWHSKICVPPTLLYDSHVYKIL